MCSRLSSCDFSIQTHLKTISQYGAPVKTNSRQIRSRLPVQTHLSTSDVLMSAQPCHDYLPSLPPSGLSGAEHVCGGAGRKERTSQPRLLGRSTGDRDGRFYAYENARIQRKTSFYLYVLSLNDSYRQSRDYPLQTYESGRRKEKTGRRIVMRVG